MHAVRLIMLHNYYVCIVNIIFVLIIVIKRHPFNGWFLIVNKWTEIMNVKREIVLTFGWQQRFCEYPEGLALENLISPVLCNIPCILAVWSAFLQLCSVLKTF